MKTKIVEHLFYQQGSAEVIAERLMSTAQRLIVLISQRDPRSLGCAFKPIPPAALADAQQWTLLLLRRLVAKQQAPPPRWSGLHAPSTGGSLPVHPASWNAASCLPPCSPNS